MRHRSLTVTHGTDRTLRPVALIAHHDPWHRSSVPPTIGGWSLVWRAGATTCRFGRSWMVLKPARPSRHATGSRVAWLHAANVANSLFADEPASTAATFISSIHPRPAGGPTGRGTPAFACSETDSDEQASFTPQRRSQTCHPPPPLTVPSRSRQSTEPCRGLEDRTAAVPPDHWLERGSPRKFETFRHLIT
jgi:hypothetical protein